MPFSPPSDTRDKDVRWQAFAKVGCRDSRPLWTDYWQRFNTITIPLLDEDAFFSDALAAAQSAHDRGHLEQLLGERSKERRAELERVMEKYAHASVDKNLISPAAAWNAVEKVGRSGSLDSFIQLACGMVWGWGEGQVGECGSRRERSPSIFTFTETQEMPHAYSPYPTVSDDWDVLDHGLGASATELPASPGEHQLPPPNLPPSGTVLRAEEDMDRTDGVGNRALEWSHKASITSSEVERASGATQQGSSAIVQCVESSPADPASPSPPSDARPSLTGSQTTPTTPPDTLSTGEVDIPQLPFSTPPLRPERREQVGKARPVSPGQKSEARGIKRDHACELKDDPDHRSAAACIKRSRRELG